MAKKAEQHSTPGFESRVVGHIPDDILRGLRKRNGGKEKDKLQASLSGNNGNESVTL